MPVVTADWMEREHARIAALPLGQMLPALQEHILWEERFLYPRLARIGVTACDALLSLRDEHRALLDVTEGHYSFYGPEFKRQVAHHGEEEVDFLRRFRVRVAVR